MIQYGRQNIDHKDMDSVLETLASDFLTTGPKVKEFEEVLAAYSGVNYAVACINGTAALHLAYMAAGIREGDEIITSPITFTATANAALYCGAKPVFVDVDSRTWQLDVNKIEAAITDRTKAIVPVHYMGGVCDMEALIDLAERYDIRVISDGAHAVGTSYKGKPVAMYGDMITYSFHPVKNITTGEGGAVLTNDKGVYENLINLRNHGLVRDSGEAKARGAWVYNQSALGYNYRITDIQCALGLSQIKKIEEFRRRRDAIVEQYDKAFAVARNIQLPTVSQGTFRHIYVIRIMNSSDGVRRRAIFDALRSAGIGVNVHYIPVYYHEYYSELGYMKGICPVAEDLYEGLLTLPLHTLMTDEDVRKVISMTCEITEKF